MFPLPIPPHLTSPLGSYFNAEVLEGSNRFFTPPHSPLQLQPKEESVPPSLSTTIAALKDALSEGTTEVEEGEIHEEPHLPLPEDLAVRGWTHLRDNIVNHITRWIHDNPEFYPALALQFEDQDTIFREV